MKREKRIKWVLVKGISPTVYLIGLKYNRHDLTLNVQDQNDKFASILTIQFNNFLTFRIVDEGTLLKGDYDLDEAVIKMGKNKSYYYMWSLYTVENSSYAAWFHQRNLCKNQDIEIIHYLIFTPIEVVEVLSIKDNNPIVFWH